MGRSGSKIGKTTVLPRTQILFNVFRNEFWSFFAVSAPRTALDQKNGGLPGELKGFQIVEEYIYRCCPTHSLIQLFLALQSTQKFPAGRQGPFFPLGYRQEIEPDWLEEWGWISHQINPHPSFLGVPKLDQRTNTYKINHRWKWNVNLFSRCLPRFGYPGTHDGNRWLPRPMQAHAGHWCVGCLTKKTGTSIQKKWSSPQPPPVRNWVVGVVGEEPLSLGKIGGILLLFHSKIWC